MNPVLNLEENTKGQDYVVTDIHGCFEILDEALSELEFDPEDDRLIIGGDSIDRGEQSERCLEYIQRPYVYSLRGNHESVFLYHFNRAGAAGILAPDYEVYKGSEWIKNQDPIFLTKMATVFNDLPIAIKIQGKKGASVGVVHADIPNYNTWGPFSKKLQSGDKLLSDKALWSRDRLKAIRKGETDWEKSKNMISPNLYEACNDQGLKKIRGVARVFFGHAAQADGVLIAGNCFYIDTGAVFKDPDNIETAGCGLTVANIRADTEAFLGKIPSDRKFQLIR